MKNINKILVISVVGLFLFGFIGSTSAATFTRTSNDFFYSTKDKSFNIYFNDVAGFILTNNYKKVSSVKLFDSDGKSTNLNKNNISNKKTANGYTTNIDFDKNYLKLKNIKKVQVNFEKQPDLQIKKISKKGSYYYITVKNNGDAKSKSNQLGIYVQKNLFSKKKLIKKIKVPSLKSKQTKKIKVSINKKYKKYYKIAMVDYKNKINERYEYNNQALFA